MVAVVAGLAFGVLMLVISLLGGAVTVNLITTKLSGIEAGVTGLIVGPIIFGLLGTIMALFSYWPFTLGLKLIKGLEIEGEWK